MAYSNKIGDSQPVAKVVAVAALPVSVVTQAEIADIDADVNDADVSGKREGSIYLMKETTGSKLVLVVAAGSAKDDVWWRQDTAAEDTASDSITPA